MHSDVENYPNHQRWVESDPLEAKAEAGEWDRPCKCARCGESFGHRMDYHYAPGENEHCPGELIPIERRALLAEAREEGKPDEGVILRVAVGLVLEAYDRYDTHASAELWGTKLHAYLDQLRRVSMSATAHRDQTEAIAKGGLAPASAGTEGPGLAVLQGLGHLPGWEECPECKACWRVGDRQVHWWDCAALAREGEKHE